MPAHKRLLVKSEWKTAGKKRKCYHDPKNHSIAKGEDVLEVAVGMGGAQGYCRACGQAMVAIAITRLQQMHPLN